VHARRNVSALGEGIGCGAQDLLAPVLLCTPNPLSHRPLTVSELRFSFVERA
jgi:hypothetical protein